MRKVPTITCLPVLLVLVLAACAHPSTVPQTPVAGVTSAATAATPSTKNVLSGVVDTAPACPGPERMDAPCPPRPLAGATVTVSAGGTVLATTTTDASGLFTLQMLPGRYLVTARQLDGLRSQVSMLVQVPQSQRLELTVDSGIR